MCPFRCGPYCALIPNTEANLKKKKNFSVLRYWSWLKLQVFFRDGFFCLSFSYVCVSMMFRKFGEFLFSHSHRANQQRKKAFDLCSVCAFVVLEISLSVFFLLFSFIAFCSFTFIFIRFIVTRPPFSLLTYIHIHTRVVTIHRFNSLSLLASALLLFAWNYRKI